MKLAIQTGHTKGTGAVGFGNVQEYDFNSKVTAEMVRLAPYYGVDLLVTDRDPELNYSAAVRKTAAAIKEFDADLCLELHFNSAGESAKGCEILHYCNSSNGERAAHCMAVILKPMLAHVNIPMRGDNGVRSLWYHKVDEDKAYSNRGSYYVYATPCPALIMEPFFGSNPREMEVMSKPDSITQLARGYLMGAARFAS